jgi:predicted Zn-dependent protease
MTQANNYGIFEFMKYSFFVLRIAILFEVTSSVALATCPVPSQISQVDRTQFSQKVQTEAIRKAIQIRQIIAQYPTQCPIADHYSASILQRLISSSHLSATAYPGIDVVTTMGCFTRDYNMEIDSAHIQMVQLWLRNARSEEEYAFPLAHELAHFILGHEEEQINYRFTHSGYGLDWFPMRIREETDADQYGMQLLANAGYNASAAPDALKHVFNLDGTGLGGGDSEHGSNKDRFLRLKNQNLQCSYPKEPSISVDSKSKKELSGLN